MSNFFLQNQFPLLAELGEKGEHYLYTDPNACLFKLRFLGEKVVELMFQYDKEPDPTDHSQVQRIRYLEAEDYNNRFLYYYLQNMYKTLRNQGRGLIPGDSVKSFV